MEEEPVASTTRSGKRYARNDDESQSKKEEGSAVVTSPPSAKKLKQETAADDFQAMAKILLSSPSTRKTKEILEITRNIRRLLAVERNSPVQKVVKAGLVPPLVDLLSGRYSNNEIKHEAVWALTNVACLDSTPAIEAGILPHLAKIIQNEKGKQLEQAIMCLGNLVSGSTEHRDLALKLGLLAPLLPYLGKSKGNKISLTLLRTIVWTISRICSGVPSPTLCDIEPVIGPLCALVQQEGIDEEAFVDIMWSLVYISGGGDVYVQRIITTGVVPFLVKQINGRFVLSSCLPLARCLGNVIASEGDDQTEIIKVMLDAGLLDELQQLLKAKNFHVGSRVELCKLLTKLFSSCVRHNDEEEEETMTKILSTNPKLLEILVDCAMNDPKPRVKVAASKVLLSIVKTESKIITIDRIIELAGLKNKESEKTKLRNLLLERN